MAASKNPTAKEIWDTLSKVNVNEHTDKKAGLTYLSWAWAWSYMMDHYPDLIVKWHGTTDENGVTRDITIYPGGTASVSCSVTIGDVKREMWLPVMDYKNKSITNPDSMAINTAKMRCLTKCFGIFGLGCYIYAGEDLPKEGVEIEDAPKKKATPKKKESADMVTSEEAAAELKTVVNDVVERGWVPEGSFAQEIRSVVKNPETVAAEAIMKLIDSIKETAAVAFQLDDLKEGEANA